jgi:hypothetical protein
MKSSNLPPGLSPLWLISLALVLGTIIVAGIPVSIATGDKIKSSDWIGFAGSIAAGTMTLIAATLAWFAVQRQIKSQEDAEERAAQRSAEERTTEMAEAKYAATIVLTHTVHAAAAVLNVHHSSSTHPKSRRLSEDKSTAARGRRAKSGRSSTRLWLSSRRQ